MNKKKIYISLPIAFQEDTVYKRNECAKTYLEMYYPKYEYISPIDANHIDDEALELLYDNDVINITQHEISLQYENAISVIVLNLVV